MAGGENPADGLPLLDRLVATLRAHAAADRGEEVFLATFVDRLNQLYDARRERVLAARQGLEPFVWTVLLLGRVCKAQSQSRIMPMVSMAR